MFDKALRQHIVFSDHSLATDSVFAEVQLVSCRNVLIYFNRELQDRAVGLFRESLCRKGFLGIGAKESLRFSAHADAFDGARARGSHLPEEGRGMSLALPGGREIDAVVIGTSAGGVEALSRAAAGTCRPASRAPVFIVLHLPRERPSLLAEHLRAALRAARCAKRQDKEPVEPGTIYFAPPDYHLLIDDGAADRALERRAGALTPGRRSTSCSNPPPTSTAAACSGSS